MKLTKIFGIVLSLHVVVILLVMFQPGCQTADKKPPATSEAPQEKPAFNGGLSTPETTEPKPIPPTGPVFANPTRPDPGDLIVPGQSPIEPTPLPPVFVPDPGPINLAPTDVTVYKIQRGDTLWGVARKNNISLSQLLAGNPSLDKNSRLAIGQQIMLPAGGAPS
ncbi:MAG: hypothetical protein CMI29_03625, partial [Opitutae bacterium]|nr:hypothetical protein [Opitutae bacterium]